MYTALSVLIGLVCINVWIQFGSRLILERTIIKEAVSFSSIQSSLLAILLLVFFNMNQLAGSSLVFGLFSLATLTLLMTAWWTLPTSVAKSAVVDFLWMLLLELVVVSAVFILFGLSRFWLLESPNHDSLIYFEGMTWAIERALLVSSDDVRAQWGLGGCGEGAMWLGYNCSLYRGGTYTLAAWVQYFAATKTGNGLYLLLTYVAVLAWMTITTTLDQTISRSRLHLIYLLGFSLLLTFSTSVLGALINSNLATMLASSCVALVIATLSAQKISLWSRSFISGLWVSVGTHIYAESIFYAGLIFSISLVIEYIQEPRRTTFQKVSIGFGIFGLTLLLGANYTLASAVRSILLINTVAEGGNWPAWYIDAAPWTWLGSFVSGVLMGTFEMASYPIAFAASIVTLLALSLVLRNPSFRPVTIALAITSVAAIYLIEIRSYRYGEHKILQLLGISWYLILVFGIREAFKYPITVMSNNSSWIKWRKFQGILITVATCYLIFDYGIRGVRILRSVESVHSIYPGIQKLTSYIRPGDSVLINDSGWTGMEKFQKSHYLTFLIHNQKARVVLPNGGGGGYYKNILNNTLKDAGDIQWFVMSPKSDVVGLPTNSELVFQTPDYVLYRMRPRNSVLSIQGVGWHDCEQNFCWTTGSFEIETLNPTLRSDYTLNIDLDYFFPPTDGKVKIAINSIHLRDAPAIPGTLSLAIPPGMNKFHFSSSWLPESPAQRGLVKDNRKIFSLIKSVRVTTAGRSTNLVEK